LLGLETSELRRHVVDAGWEDGQPELSACAGRRTPESLECRGARFDRHSGERCARGVDDRAFHVAGRLRAGGPAGRNQELDEKEKEEGNGPETRGGLAHTTDIEGTENLVGVQTGSKGERNRLTSALQRWLPGAKNAIEVSSPGGLTGRAPSAAARGPRVRTPMSRPARRPSCGPSVVARCRASEAAR